MPIPPLPAVSSTTKRPATRCPGSILDSVSPVGLGGKAVRRMMRSPATLDRGPWARDLGKGEVLMSTRPKPVVSVPKGATVLEAVRAMVEHNVSAAVVLDGERLLGVFTERDVVKRVVLKKLPPETTPVGEVMTTSVVTVREDADRSSVLR